MSTTSMLELENIGLAQVLGRTGKAASVQAGLKLPVDPAQWQILRARVKMTEALFNHGRAHPPDFHEDLLGSTSNFESACHRMILSEQRQSSGRYFRLIGSTPIKQGQSLEAPYRIGIWLRRYRRRLEPTTLQYSTISDHQALVEALLMKSILGQELIDTKFHLFSGRSAHSRKVTRLQALSANDVVLTARSEFFAELSSRTGPSDATFVDFDGSSALEDSIALDDYGYASDSDLEDEEEEKAGQTPVSDESAVLVGDMSASNDDDLLVVVDARSKIDSTVGDPIPVSPPQAATSITSTPIQEKLTDASCRNILVRDTAFRTWKALLLYLYTNKIIFSPLKSQGNPRAHAEGSNPGKLWPCSPKSMYRLGCKVRLDSVRDEAFNAIRNSLNAGNILQELSSSLTSKYPAILQMHVEILLQHIASVPVIQNIPSLVRRIVDSQLPHGADIIIDLYQKFLLQYHPRALALANAPTESEPALSQSDDELGCRPMPATSPPPAFGQPVFGQSAFGQPAFGKAAFGQNRLSPSPPPKAREVPNSPPRPAFGFGQSYSKSGKKMAKR